jgi:predicted 3-demethylubiquinone-9 3-methyltransferase (glyoxalase superfamily)
MKEIAMPIVESSQRITPFLWFDGNAEEAVDFYIAIFPNSRRVSELRSPSQTTVAEGKILVIDFELFGHRFTALNGGPEFKFNKSISFSVRCDTQQEIDFYWAKLTDGGVEVQCGWLEDRFGLSWQIVPTRIGDYIKTAKGMDAMMKMVKFDIAELERASKS